jgi:DNA-binding transcriptional regulator YiaG
MPNFAKALKSEIARISRKEARIAFSGIRKSAISLKKHVASLKSRISALEKENRFLTAAEKRRSAQQPQLISETTKRTRITSKGMLSLRRKLRLTQVEFAKLLGTTSQTIYMWEHKNGALRVRKNMMAAILSVKGLGAREAKNKIAEGQTKKIGRKVIKRKKSKR